MRKSKNHSWRARASLIWAWALFVAIQLVGGWFLDYRWQAVRFPSAAGVMARLEQEPSPEIVFLGSSRFGGGIKPEVIEPLLAAEKEDRVVSVLNAAVPCGDAIASKYIFAKLLRAGVHPRWSSWR